MSSSQYNVINGNMLEELDKLEENSIDSIVTDPPYELNFMNKGWDNAGVSFQKETWKKCLRVLKPGGYLLAFGGSRTFHRIVVAIEDAGFEICDTVMWLYGSGFPKSMDVSKGIESKLVNGSANTRDFKNLEGTRVESGNWGISKMAHTQGARPDDYCADNHLRVDKVEYTTELAKKWKGWGTCLKPSFEPVIIARKHTDGEDDNFNKNVASRYFYCAKASKEDRDEGLDAFEAKQKYYCDGSANSLEIFGSTDGGRQPLKNIHPTVKPTRLMQNLIRMVTPNGATVLDPFMGSGSTGKATMGENLERGANYKFIGIELSDEYCKIANARIEYICKQMQNRLF